MKKRTILCMMTMALLMVPIVALAENATQPTIDLTAILVAAINIIALVVARYLIPWLRAKTTAEQREKLLSAVKIAVYAAEQLIGSGNGTSKLDMVKAWLRDQGFDVDTAAVATAIEAAVQQLTLEQAATITEVKPPSTETE